MGYTAVTTNNPLNAFGFLLNQRTVTSQDFDPAKLNDPSAAHNYSADINVKLPLVNVDMFYARKGAKYQEEVYKNKAKYTQNWIAFEVRKAYTQLQFSYQAQQILQSTLEDVKRIHESRIYKIYSAVTTPFLESRKKRWTFMIILTVVLLGSLVLFYTKSVPVKMLPFDNKNEFQVVIDMKVKQAVDSVHDGERIEVIATDAGFSRDAQA